MKRSTILALALAATMIAISRWDFLCDWIAMIFMFEALESLDKSSALKPNNWVVTVFYGLMTIMMIDFICHSIIHLP